MNPFTTRFTLAAALCAAAPSLNHAQAIATTSKTGWDLAWSDEFDYTGKPDPTKWRIQVGPSNVNNEAEYYSDNLKNLHVENGNLYITSLHESVGGRNYTSGRMDTEGKAYWTYGRIEMRAILPGGQGTWPAFWSLGHNCDQFGGWPACGEIDIMEYSGSQPNTVNTNLHMRDLNYMNGNNPHGQAKLDAPYKNYHIYAMEWYQDHMDFFYDSTKVLTFTNANKGSGSWPYFNPQYIILNNAIGGSLGGNIDNSIFPTQFVVDYIRVYKPGTGQIITDVRAPANHLKTSSLIGTSAVPMYDFAGRLRNYNPHQALFPMVAKPAWAPAQTVLLSH